MAEDIHLIQRLFNTLSTAHNKADVDTTQMNEDVAAACDCFLISAMSTKSAQHVDSLYDALVASDPLAGLQRVVEMRRRGEFGVDEKVGEKGVTGGGKGAGSGHVRWVYKRVFVLLVNATNRLQICEYFLSKGGVQILLDEFRSDEFVANRHASKQDSLAIDCVGDFLSILFAISGFDQLNCHLGEVLRENGFFEVLLPYAESRYITII